MRNGQAEFEPATVFAGQHVDDPAEQHRLGELRACEQKVGECQQPAQPSLLAEELENAGVEAEDGHAGEQLGQVTEPIF
ncbi:hypothetical protein ACVWYH_002679 [Bradyrhizobium sp. GM24.11]